MTQIDTINFQIEKNGRTFIFSVQNQAPVEDAFEVAKELMIGFSSANEAWKKAQEEKEASSQTEAVEAEIKPAE